MHVLVIVRVTSFFIYTFFFHINISYYLIILGFFVVVVFCLFFAVVIKFTWVCYRTDLV